MSELRVLQSVFARQAARLILKAYELGYEVTFGEAWRTPEQAQWDVDHHTGTLNSLHRDRLAIDINLFKDGRLIEDDEGHATLGTWWKTFGPTYRWGGDFRPRQDPNHYSISPDGVRA